jgi:Flp pilus assembly CpaF family ATPase
MKKNKLWDYILSLQEQYDFDELFLKPEKSLLRLKDSYLTLAYPYEERSLRNQIQELVISLSNRLDPLHPFASGEISEIKSRYVAIIPPITPTSEFILRRVSSALECTFPGYLALQNSLGDLFERGDHLVICGISGAGKTTLLKKIMGDLFINQRVVILDSYMEWGKLPEKWTLLQESYGFFDGRGVITMGDLFPLALRLSAQRFVLGEVKYKEVEVFKLLRKVGHGSVLTTMHGSERDDLEFRLGNLDRTSCLLVEKNFHCRLLNQLI